MSSIPRPSTPQFIQTLNWILDPVGCMKTNFREYGDIFRLTLSLDDSLRTGEIPALVSDPKALQYILTHDTGKEFSSPGEVNTILEQIIGRQNLILTSGDEHRRRRQLMMPPFHGERLKLYGEIIQRITQTVLSEWTRQETHNIRTAMQKITMGVIMQAVFGLYEGDRYTQVQRLLKRRLDLTSTPLSSVILFFPWLRQEFGPLSIGYLIRKLSEATDKLLFEEIRERRAMDSGDRIDVLSLLLAAKDEDGNGLSDQDLRDELMTLLLAGHETTATALTWAMYWIHRQPEVRQRLLQELDAVSDPSDPSQFLQLPYLTAVCNETLRINPVAMLTFPRRVESPVELCGYHLNPGEFVLGCIYLIHQREDLYPQPQQFRPERFLERQFSPYEFMPFGAGVRRCVGAALAQYEMKVVLGTLLRQFEFQLMNQEPVRPARRGVTLGPHTPIRFKLVGVRSPSKVPVAV